MNINEYIRRIKDIQTNILSFVDNEQDVEEHYLNIQKDLENQKIGNNKRYLKTILRIIACISNNHHRYPEFNEKIEKILVFIQHEIKEKYTNYELFKIFKNNKRILRFLINMKILIIDENIKTIMKKPKYESLNYFIYLFPENTLKVKTTYEIDDKFENKLKEGENEYLITKIIREDLIDEFISYIEEFDYSLNNSIQRSIFETNIFLIKHPNTTLIEYSSFFGSNQIFEYLMNKGVKLTQSLWLYSIHGNNPKIINHLSENKIQLSLDLYYECIKESIKCHHINIFNYFSSNFKTILDCDNFNNHDFIKSNIVLNSFHYFNFICFTKQLKDSVVFNCASRYDYPEIVLYLLNEPDIEMNYLTNANIVFNIIIY